MISALLPGARPGSRRRGRALPAGALAALLTASLLLAGLPSGMRAQEPPERRVFAYFYYWYEPPNGVPYVMQNNEMLTNHFPAQRPADWRSAEWYKGQLRDMQTAGVDVALAVYWGDALYESTGWSTGGLEPLVQALDELDAAGERHPKIGLFFDTYVLEGAALTDPDKRDWFGDQIRTYFRLMPERHRALEAGRPIIWMYLSNFANSFDQPTFETLSARLSDDLGAPPFWIADVSWRRPTITDGEGQRRPDRTQLMGFDAFYRWGAASRGTLFVEKPLPIAAVGPGYDDTAVYDRGDERSDRLREDGCFYARNWDRARKLGARWVVIETWNENYEGSGIAETVEWGREYVDESALYSRAFKADLPIPIPRRCVGSPDDELAADDDDDGPEPIAAVGPAGPTGEPAPAGEDEADADVEADSEVHHQEQSPSGAQCPGKRRPRSTDRGGQPTPTPTSPTGERPARRCS